MTNLFLSAFWLWSTAFQFSSFVVTHKVSTLFMALCQGLNGIFFFIRPYPKTVSRNFFANLVAFMGTFCILLYQPSLTTDTVLGEVVLSVGGVLLFLSVLSLNTSFGIIPADRSIKTDGMYRFVRHPIYMSYLFFFVGYCINNPTVHNVLVICASATLECIRIFFEENHLLNDPEYAAYAKKVRFRLIPYIF